MERTEACDLSQEAIAYMSETQLIQGIIDAFSLEPVLRVPTLALMRLRAKSLGVEDIFNDTVKGLTAIDKRAGAEYARELARQNNRIPLVLDKRGDVLNSTDNYLRVMRGDPFFGGVKYNALRNTPEIEDGNTTRRWDDTDSAAMRTHIESAYGIYNKDKVRDAFLQTLRERSYHPIREIIDGVKWDGEERVGNFLARWMKCEDSDYTREVSRLIFAGGIHRVYNPGCKFDDMPVLIGTQQGEGKSTIVRWLAIEDRFFREVNEFEGQKGMEAIDGAWICEVSELLAVTKVKEQEAIKSFLSRLSDVYRKAYREFVTEGPRQCIFIGTTNKTQFISDKTGGRRFFPVAVHSSGYELFDHEDEIRAYILQCWAEARHKMLKGEMPPYADKTITRAIKAAQEDAQEDDYRIGMITAYLEGKDSVCGIELWEKALGNEYQKPTKRDEMEIGMIMQAMPGWERMQKCKRVEKYGPQRLWVRKVVEVGVDTFTDVSEQISFPDEQG